MYTDTHFHCQIFFALFSIKYTKIRQWMQTIRENIETMKGYIREMSQQTFKTSSQKCEFIHLHFLIHFVVVRNEPKL